jgi:hypothetical protein
MGLTATKRPLNAQLYELQRRHQQVRGAVALAPARLTITTGCLSILCATCVVANRLIGITVMSEGTPDDYRLRRAALALGLGRLSGHTHDRCGQQCTPPYISQRAHLAPLRLGATEGMHSRTPPMIGMTQDGDERPKVSCCS